MTAPISTYELLKLHTSLTEEARKLMEKKNTDYRAVGGDPFGNFRMARLMRVEPAVGLMIRMMDKHARILSFIERGTLAVSDESWHDCCIDLINYSILLHGLLEEIAEKCGAKNAGIPNENRANPGLDVAR